MIKTTNWVTGSVRISVFIVCLMAFVPQIFAQQIRVDGTVVGIGGRFAGVSRPFRLIVNSLTTPGQVSELHQALRSDGQDGLLRALSRMNAGRITVGNGVGLRANAVIADRWGNGGTKLTVFYERNISFYELRYGSRSEDYKIGYAEIFLDSRGRGQGSFIPAARVRVRDGNTWEVEDFGIYPARLMGLRSTGPLLR
jgi:hypothetical protein